jgi:hypothetical protein
MRLTRERILSEICAKWGIDPDHLGLERFTDDGVYYMFTGKLAACLTGSVVDVSRLGDLSLERWLCEFEAMLADSDLPTNDLNKYIDSLNWDEPP